MTSAQKHALNTKRTEYANARRYLGTITKCCNMARTKGKPMPDHWKALLGQALRDCASARRELKRLADDLYYELMGDRAA